MLVSISSVLYLLASVLFIGGLQGLSTAATSRRGNILAILGMIITIITSLLMPQIAYHELAIIAICIGAFIGLVIAKKIEMTALPQLVAAFHSLVGLSAVFVAIAAFCSPEVFHIGTASSINSANLFELSLGAIIGSITFSGSVLAFMKLQGILGSLPVFYNQRRYNFTFSIIIAVLLTMLMMSQSPLFLLLLIIASFVFGIILILPIGGADMPVVVSMLNSYSGWAAAGIGFTLNNHLLLISGALVGSSGAILSYIMCKGMNRSLINIIFGSSNIDNSSQKTSAQVQQKPYKISSAEDAAYMMSQASNMIIVPGYGMAVAHAQHALKEMVLLLKENNISVRFAIHPVAGRMPGHMNVLLAEAGISYDDVLELDEINSDFASTNIVFVIGANDITNPAARVDKSSPIYGMPILDVDKAETIFFVKRTMAAGYAGIDNELFYAPNTMMLLGDAKKVCEGIIKALKDSH